MARKINKKNYVECKSYASIAPNEFVAELCDRSGESKAAIARRAGISPTILTDITSGHRPLTLARAKQLSKALNVSVECLLGLNDARCRKVAGKLAALRSQISRSRSIGENTERTLLRIVDEAIEENEAVV